MKILVLCTGNSCRSQMAEGLFREYGNGKIAVRSAGINPIGVNPRAVQVMHEIGIDISQHTSNNLTEYLNDDFDYVITVCDNANESCPVWPGKAKRLHWPFDDPHYAEGSEEEVLNEFRRVRDLIGEKIKSWLGIKRFDKSNKSL
jgi:arsenate reductase